jgi:hypothetical protein
VMGTEMQALGDKLTFEDVMTTSQDQWNQLLSGMSIDNMIILNKIQGKAASAAQVYGSIPTVAQGAAKMAQVQPSGSTTPGSDVSTTGDTPASGATTSANPEGAGGATGWEG